MKYKFFLVIFVGSFLCVVSCKKEPKTGDYKGTFKGRLETDTSITNYETVYYFDVTHSTKKELRLKEKQSQITSVLKKHEKDSIEGMIAFGSIQADLSVSVTFNTISIQGKYDKKSITGRFLATFGDKNKEYFSEGSFIMSAY